MDYGSTIPSARSDRAWVLIPVVLFGVVLQSTVAPAMEIRGIRPDGLLLLSVHLGLRFPRGQTVLAAWAMGFLADLLTIQPAGWMSASYALTAWSVGAVRGALNRDSLVTEVCVVLIGGFIVFGLWLVGRIAVGPPSAGWEQPLVADWLGRAVYSALWAIPLFAADRLLASLFAAAPVFRPGPR